MKSRLFRRFSISIFLLIWLVGSRSADLSAQATAAIQPDEVSPFYSAAYDEGQRPTYEVDALTDLHVSPPSGAHFELPFVIVPGGTRQLNVTTAWSYSCWTPQNPLTATIQLSEEQCSLATDDFTHKGNAAATEWGRNYNGIFTQHVVNVSNSQRLIAFAAGENKNERLRDSNGDVCYQNTINTDVPCSVCASGYDENGQYHDCWAAYSSLINLSWILYDSENHWGIQRRNDEGPILWPANGYTQNGQKSSHGLRHPHGFVDGGYIYVFYQDTSNGSGNRGLGVRIARAPEANGALPGSWQTYCDGAWVSALPSGFSSDRIAEFYGSQGGCATPILPVAEDQISFAVAKTTRGSYIGVEERITSSSWEIRLWTSTNLLDWQLVQSVASRSGDWYQGDLHYPVFLSADGWSSDLVDDSNFYILGTRDGVLRTLHVQRSNETADPEFGIQESHLLWQNENFTLPKIATMLDRVKSAGLKWLRLDVEWIHVEPERGKYGDTYLAKLTAVLELMKEREISPIAILQTTPDWAKTIRPGCWEAAGNPDQRQWAIPPNNAADYGAVATYLADKYQELIRTWEIWNEPNICAFWNTPEGPDAARYSELLRAGYLAIKGVDSGITVLGGALSGNDFNYLQGMYANQAAPYFDALSVHPYNPGQPPEWLVAGQEQYSFAAIPILKEEMVRAGDASKPIWITEMGWTTQAYPWTAAVSDATRAEYIRRAVQMVRSWPYVRVFITYYLDNSGEPEDGYELWVGDQPTETWWAYTAEVARMPYNDVPLDNPFFVYIRDLAAQGIVDPVQGREFQPFQPTTRATLARWIVRARGWSFDITGGPHFGDVPVNHADYPYIETAYAHGVISGYSAANCPGGTAACFKPDNPLTRGQMSKMIVNAMGWPIDTSGGPHFRDVQDVPTFPFYNQIETIYNRGVVSGYECGGACREFRWGADLTRGQLSKVLANAIQIVAEASLTQR